MEGVWKDFLAHVVACETIEWDHIFVTCEPACGQVTLSVSKKPPLRHGFPKRDAGFEFCVVIDLLQAEFNELPAYKGLGYAYGNALRSVEKRVISAVKSATAAEEVRALLRQLNKERKRTAHFTTKANHHYSEVERLAIPSRAK